MAFADIMQQAIGFEEEAFEFYNKAIDIVKSEQARAILRELGQEEAGHKARLVQMLEKGPSWAVSTGKVEQTIDLRIGDHIMPGQLTSKSDFQDALLVAIKREEASLNFYSAMSGLVTAEARPVFEFLANEEAKHKNKVQSIYDEVVYQDF